MENVNVDALVEQARIKRTPPNPSRETGQRSLQFNQPFFMRWLPQWRQPDWLGAEKWRSFVQAQPVAVECREAIINYILSLDWKIIPRDSNKMDELKSEIDYYTAFLEDTGEYEFSDLVEWLLKDFLDLPFGGAAELGREGDNPEGRVLWIKLVDGGTLFPTHNTSYPVGQALPSDVQRPVFFPKHAINRLYMSPRTEFIRYGWGMAPPEKIYLAIELISRGDKYYSNLLLDTPEAGLLDLINMSKTSAEEWIEAFKSYMSGVDPFKIPVLYEHDTPAQWIPFGRPPTELMFDRVTTKYAASVCAGYGLTLSDIGLAASSSGGDTLAGSIRQERKSKRQGYAKAKKRLTAWFNRLIDPTGQKLQFAWIDLDDELAIAVGRARLANSTAFGQFIDKQVITPEEARLQSIADGTFTVSLPEKKPESEFDLAMTTPERPGMLGKPVAPSQGGHGEVLPRSEFEKQLTEIVTLDELLLRRLIHAALPKMVLGLNAVLDELNINEVGLWSDWQQKIIWGDVTEDVPELIDTVLKTSFEQIENSIELRQHLLLDSKPIVDEFLNVYCEALSERAYVVGEIDDVSKYELPQDQEKAFCSQIESHIYDLNDSMSSLVSKAVQAGVTVYFANVTGKLDETLKIDDNLINCVQNSLKALAHKLQDDFGKILLEIMESKEDGRKV